jgi:hypothetical protein
VPDDEAVRIFVEFKRIESAIKGKREKTLLVEWVNHLKYWNIRGSNLRSGNERVLI